MQTSFKSIAHAHADHRHWKSELDTWADDIANWKKENDDALRELKKIADEIHEHGKALDEHAAMVAALDSHLGAHEKTMASTLKTGVTSVFDAELNKNHEQHAAKHAQQRDAHERIKKHHHQAMAQVAILRIAMEAAM